MNPPAPGKLGTDEIKTVALISLLAVLHVFVFLTAFPFFNSVDEQLHFDLVARYAQGDIPRKLEPIAPESIRYVALYHSLAYLSDPAGLPAGRLLAPPWTLPPEQMYFILAAREKEWRSILNPEGAMPPLYYSVAGAWWRFGGIIGLDGARRLYWLRGFNLAVLAAVVWLAWLAAWKIYPENFFVRLAAPALIALMPQTAFYSINSDILPPLFFGGAFLLLLKFAEAERPSPRLAAGLGLLLAASFLTKISTLPLIAAALLFVAAKTWRTAREKKLQRMMPALAVLAACTALPMIVWMIWCKKNFGDLTGAAVKIRALTWTERPVHEWISHPLFTLHGLKVFFGGTFATFWQGEFFWLHRPLAIRALDVFYAVLTAALLALAWLATVTNSPPMARRALRFAFGGLAAALLFFALLSVKFDFHECFYPSREHPFFTSGRLYLGLLVPLMILFATGLDFALQKFSVRMKFIFLGALLAFMLAGEIAVDWRVFSCEYNWYHF